MSTVANFATGQGVYDATLINGPVLDNSANVGTGDLSLNAVASQYMSASATTWSPPAITAGNGISFSGWFYPAAYSGATYQSAGATLFDISGTSTSVSMYCDGTGKLVGNFNGNVVTCPVVVQNNSSPTVYGSNNGWHFFCYTIYCTSTGTALQSIYLDASCAPGLNKATTVNTTIYVQIMPNSGNYIGFGKGQGPTTWAYFNGKVDDFRFYNRVLTPPEISVLYQYNYKSNTTPTIAAQLTYDISYSNAVQIDVSGTFSGLDVSRSPTFSDTLTGGAESMKVSAASLQLVGDTTWAYVDTNVYPDTSYSYTIKPYIMNSYGSTITTMGSITTTPILNGFFNQATTLPASGASLSAASAVVGGWTFTGTSTNTLCNRSVTGYYTGTLPSTVTYYMDISQSVISTTQMYQNIGIYSGTSGFVSFYMWPRDISYNASQTVTVTLGAITLLNDYAFATSTVNAVPYTSFNLPFSMTRVGTYPLIFTFDNSAANRSGVNISGIQVRMQDTTSVGIGYKTVDPSFLQLYYNFDTSLVTTGAGYSLYNSANGTPYSSATLDASMVGGATISSISPASLMGVNSLYLPGGSSYAQIGNWTLPAAAVGRGFSITGWIYRAAASSTVESSNATIATFGTTDGSYVSIFMNQRTGSLDFSCNVILGPEYISPKYVVQPKMWTFFAMTCLCNSTNLNITQCNYNFYMNDIQMVGTIGGWPNRSSVNPMTFVNNFLGGVPVGKIIPANSAGPLEDFSGNIDDFRVYNRVLSKGDVDALWSYGFSLNQYANLIDPTALGIYYPMDPGSDLLVKPSAISMGTTTNIQPISFILNWTGGVGIGAVYSYSITQAGVPFTTFTASGINTTRIIGNGFLPNIPYIVTVYSTSVGGTVSASTSVTLPVANLTITPAITGWNGANDLSGVSTTNNIDYRVYAFKPVVATSGTASYTLTYNCTTASYIYLLAVGGGGSGNGSGGGGGGAGGVIMMPILLQPTAGTSTIVIAIGGGGTAPAAGSNGIVAACTGISTTVTFTASSTTYTAGGGGQGHGFGYVPSIGSYGGSTGGSGNTDIYSINSPQPNAYSNYNYTNFGGGLGNGNIYGSGGGGGAGSRGRSNDAGNVNIWKADGGDGINCFLPGISDFTPTGYSSFSSYYWGGGGGAGNCTGPGVGANGGLGGGGGGSTDGTGTSYGGIGGITIGSNGVNQISGSGGANTGSGGGGGHNNNLGGNGGSGIVVIAFPQTVIATNALAVLPTILYNSGKYKDVLSSDTFNGTRPTLLSSAAYNSIKEAFSCKLINYNYFGPIMTLRYNTDTYGNYTQNFYSDVCGNMGTQYLGTGQSVSAWLTSAGANTTYAFVTKWYNQGMDICFNCATQYTLGSQPIYDISYGLMNFGDTSGLHGTIAIQNGYLRLPNGAYPGVSSSTTTDTSYAFIVRHGNYNSTSTMTLYSGGSGSASNKANTLILNLNSPGYYSIWWNANDLASATANMASNNVLTTNYNATGTTMGTRNFYVNGTLNNSGTTTGVAGIHQQDSCANYIGYCYNTPYAVAYQFQMYNLVCFSNALGVTTDRNVVEAIPYTYTASPTMTLTVINVTSTNFVLSTSIVTNATYFTVYVNSSATLVNGSTTISAASILANFTVNPATSGPWDVNVYAYNSTYALLASAYIANVSV